MRVAFIGLGIMGAPMAVNLAAAGFDVIGVHRRPEPPAQLVEAGVATTTDLAQAVRRADVVITMLPDGPDVEGVVLGEDGVYALAQPGTLHVDMSSIAPGTARALAAAADDAGVATLDAPVSGGEAAAIQGGLSIMVGGQATDLQRARPLLEAVGSTIVHVGDHGAGQTVKAANQLMVAGHLQLLAEAMVFLDAHDVELDAALEVLGGGLAGSTVLARKGAAMVRHEFAPGFRIDLHHKDLGIVTTAAREAGVVVPLGSLTAQLLAAQRAQGRGSLDHSALLLGVEEMSGRASPDARSSAAGDG